MFSNHLVFINVSARSLITRFVHFDNIFYIFVRFVFFILRCFLRSIFRAAFTAYDYSNMIAEPYEFSIDVEGLENDEIQEGTLKAEQYIKLFSAYLYNNELCAAKFLWRRVPDSLKINPELQKVWSLGKALWTKHYTQAYELIDCKWSDVLEPIMAAIKCRIQQDTLKFISTHYENIQFDKFQTLMGVDKEQAESIVEKEGWKCVNGYVIPVAINEPDLRLSGSIEILDRLVTLSSFTSYIEN